MAVEGSLVFLLFVAVLDFLMAGGFSVGAVAVAVAIAVAIEGAIALPLVFVASAGAVAVAVAAPGIGNAGGVTFSVMVEENAGAENLVSTLALGDDGNSAVLDGGGGGTSS